MAENPAHTLASPDPGLHTIEHHQNFYNGLQVVGDEHPKEVVGYAVAPYKPYAEQKLDDTNRSEGYLYHPVGEAPEPPPPKPRRKLLIRVAIGLAVLVVVLVAILVPVLITTQKHGNGGTQGNGTTAAPVERKSIRLNSGLTVTSWRSGANSVIFLYYQGPDGQLRFSKYDTGRGSYTTNNSYWEDPVLIPSPTTPAKEAALSVGCLLWGSLMPPQVELFFTNSTSDINGVNFNAQINGFAPQGDSIDGTEYPVAAESALASYWPFTVSQLYSGGLSMINNILQANLLSTASWDRSDISLPVEAARGTKLAIVPTSTNYTSIVTVGGGGYGVVYQGTNGQIVATIPRDSSIKSSIPQSWPATSAFPSVVLQAGSALAAFSTARSNAGLVNGPVNTFILYQNVTSPSFALQQIWTDDGATWKTSAPPALGRADNGTHIACVTMPTTNNDVSGAPLYLEAASELNRCYFQRDGGVVEVQLKGTDWVELGTLPMS